MEPSVLESRIVRKHLCDSSQAIFSFDYIHVKYEVWTLELIGGLLSNIIRLEFDHNCD